MALTVAAVLSAGLDMLGVLAMMPLMQMLSDPVNLPLIVEEYVSPLVGTKSRTHLLLYSTLFIGLMFIGKNTFMIWMRWTSLGIIGRAQAAAQAEMLRRYVHADYLSHRRRSASDIIQSITGSVNTAFQGVILSFVAIVADVVTAFTLIATIVIIAPTSSVVAIALFGGTALLMVRVLKPHALRFGLQSLELNTQMWEVLNPAIEGFRESRIFGKEDFFVDRFRVNRQLAVHPQRAQQVLGELPRYLMEIVLVFAVLVVAIILFATRPESEAFGTLAVFAAASTRIAPALNRTVGGVNVIRTSFPALERLVSQMNELEGTGTAVGPAERQAASDWGDIRVNGVSFRYPDASEDVLSDVTVSIPQGHTVALVGTSGAGKTTFADLLLGLFSPTKGCITSGELDIKLHPLEWRSQLAAVSQRVYLWDASVRDLITFGEAPAEVDEERLHLAIDQSQLRDFIDSLPQGLDTFVGEGGARISGGQAQRIGIARALYSQPSVLILDEATSALDNETEHQITKTLEALRGRMTIIVIAHRLSTIRNADEILFFSHGKLADRGSMESLQQSCPEFAHLVALGKLS